MRPAAWCLQNDIAKRSAMSVLIKVLEGVTDVEDNPECNLFNSSVPRPMETDNNGFIASPALPLHLSGPGNGTPTKMRKITFCLNYLC